MSTACEKQRERGRRRERGTVGRIRCPLDALFKVAFATCFASGSLRRAQSQCGELEPKVIPSEVLALDACFRTL